MQFKSLRSRITFLFLTLILVVQFLGFVAIWLSINKNARAGIAEQLVTGEKVLRTVFVRRGENLSLSASILANDYGFRQSIASNDSETIKSALENHGARIEADISMLYSPEGVRQVVAGGVSTSREDMALEDATVVKLIESAQSGSAFKLAILNGAPYQLVAVPVKAPLTIAWIVMGFKIDASWAVRVKNLSNLEVSFLTKTHSGPWILASGTLSLQSVTSKSILAGLPPNIGEEPQDKELIVDDLNYGTRYVQIHHEQNQFIVAVLQRSISEALAPYTSLQLNLLILTVLGALVFVAGSIFTARQVTKPLNALLLTADSLGKGDYSVAIEANSSDEIGNLGRTFNRMREAISQREQKISKLAYWDELTELPNRAYFNEQLEKFVENAKLHHDTFSVLMMDLDRFKHINDVLGHGAADNLLAAVAKRLVENCKSGSDVVARLGGDEFGIILADTNSLQAVEVAQRIQATLETPIALSEYFVDLSAGMGIANYPEHTKNVELLVSRAEMAMYEAKAKHLRVSVYHSDMDVSNEENLSLVSEIKAAVENSQFTLYVQPKIDFATGQVLAVEALVRWQHPVRGLVYPEMFIPFAEQTGHVGKITLWMLSEAARYAALWQRQGIDIALAVNLSAKDLIDIELPNKLKGILSEHQLFANSLTLEITESSIMDDPARALDTVERIARMGIKLSIDDFGTGYSSLAYLKRLPVSELKIDKSFVMNIEHDQSDVTIVKSTIELGHNLGLKVVAEGIENKRVWGILKTMGCDYGQGYLLAKPMPASHLIDWIAHWKNTVTAAPVKA